MPSSMIHLCFAKKVRPDGNALFYLGNIAPDAVKDWHVKDITHFRNLKDRQPALIKLVKETKGNFAEGILFHLYLDWKWDTIIRPKFIEKTGADWFVPYRKELSLAGSYSFHHTEWAKQVWNDMDAIDIHAYDATPCASVEDVIDFVSRNNKWHHENITEQSPAFPPELIEDFLTCIATEFVEWIAKIK